MGLLGDLRRPRAWDISVILMAPFPKTKFDENMRGDLGECKHVILLFRISSLTVQLQGSL